MVVLGRRRLAALAVLGCLAAVLVLGILAYGGYRQRPVQVGAFATPYDQRVLDDPFEIMVVQNDGQAYATLARDPSLSRADEELRSAAEASYRAQRPLYAYLAWGVSLGRSGWVAPAMWILCIAGGGAAVAGCGALLAARGASPWYALVVILLPGFYFSTAFVCPETLALGFAAFGILAWERGRTVEASVLLVASALTRETMLIGFAVLVLEALRRRSTSLTVAAALPFAAVAGWFTVLFLHFGHLPTEEGEGRIGAPFVGLVQALDGSSVPIDNGNVAYLVLFLVMGAACLVRARHDHLTWMSAAYVAFILLSGEKVWMEAGFPRVMLPMGAYALVALVGALRSTSVTSVPRNAASAAEGSSPRPGTPGHGRGSPVAAEAPPSA